MTPSDANPSRPPLARAAEPDPLEQLSKVGDAPAPVGAPVLPSIVEAIPEPSVDHPAPAPEPNTPIVEPVAAAPVTAPVPPPVVVASSSAGPVLFRRRPRVRRVTRVVRHIDTWSVFKVALVFNTILYAVCLTAGVLLWNVAYATGTIDNVEQFFEQFGWSSFEFNGGQIYHNAWVGGLFVAVGLTGFVVLLATLFNLIADLVGGVRVTVLEEEVIVRPRPPDGVVLPPESSTPVIRS